MKKRFFAIFIAVLLSISLLLSSCTEAGKPAFKKAKDDPDAFVTECLEKTKEALKKDIPVFSLLKEMLGKGKLTVNADVNGLDFTANAFVENKNVAFTFDAPVPQAQGMVVSAGAYCKDGVLTLDLSKIFGDGYCASVKTENIFNYVKALLPAAGLPDVVDKVFGILETLDIADLTKRITDLVNELTDILGSEAKEEEATVNGETKKFVVLTTNINNEKVYAVIEKVFEKLNLADCLNFLRNLSNETSFRNGYASFANSEEITAQTVIDAIKESGAELGVEYSFMFDPDTYLPVRSTFTANIKTGEAENTTVSGVTEYPKNMSLLGKFTETLEISVNGEATSINITYEAEEKDGVVQGKLELKGAAPSEVLFSAPDTQSMEFTYNKENGDFTVKFNASAETAAINGKFTYDSEKFTFVVGSVSAYGITQTVGLTIAGEKNAEFPEIPAGTEIMNSDDFNEFLQTIVTAFGGMPGEPFIDTSID